jgi:hypothetical protein
MKKNFKLTVEVTGTLRCAHKGLNGKCSVTKDVKFTRAITHTTVNMVHLMPIKGYKGWTVISSLKDGTYTICPEHSQRRSL